MSGYVYCSECDGEGRVYNNADPTSGQWVECECAEMISVLKETAKVIDAEVNSLHGPGVPTAYNTLLPRIKKFLDGVQP